VYRLDAADRSAPRAADDARRRLWRRHGLTQFGRGRRLGRRASVIRRCGGLKRAGRRRHRLADACGGERSRRWRRDGRLRGGRRRCRHGCGRGRDRGRAGRCHGVRGLRSAAAQGDCRAGHRQCDARQVGRREGRGHDAPDLACAAGALRCHQDDRRRQCGGPSDKRDSWCRTLLTADRKGIERKVDEPDPGTGHNGWGCFVPDLTRLAALPCGEARRWLF